MHDPDIVEVVAGNEPVGSVIWLHGLGADGHDFEPIIPELRLPAELALRFLFPHAPIRPVTVNGGMPMRAWYDIKSFDAEGRADAAGIAESTARVESLIRGEIERGIAADRIVVAGFSQGGAIALNTLLTTQHDLAGVMALSTYVAAATATDDATSRRDIPLLMAHGSVDPVLPMQLGSASRDHLLSAGFAVDWREYPMAHAVCPQEIADISSWLRSVFGVIGDEARK